MSEGDVAQLGLSIDSSSVGNAATALDKFTASGKNAGDAADALAASGAKSNTALSGLQGASTNNATASTKAAMATSSHAAALSDSAKAANAAAAELGHFDEIAAVIESRMAGLGASTGFFGQILSVIGPGGLAAAAGIGALLVVVDQLVTSANRMGEFAQQLQTMSTLTGLSTTSLQSLDKAAEAFGMSADQTGEFLTRFTEQVAELKTGTGNLYTQLLKVDPALLAQISVAKSATDAVNLLAAAYAKAGANQNSLANAAAGGRGGAQFGLLLGKVADSGGVQGVNAATDSIDQLTQQQTKQWATLNAQITATFEDAKNNFASIFTGPVLDAELKFADGLLSISRAAKEFALSDDFQTYMKFIGNGAKTGAQAGLAAGPIGVAAGTVAGGAAGATAGAFTLAVEKFGQWVGLLPATLPKGAGVDFNDFNANFSSSHAAEGPNNLGNPTGNVGTPGPAAAASPGVTSAIAQAQISFLGSAATSTDKYNAAVAKLNLDLSNNGTLTTLQGRAMEGLRLDKAATDASQYAGALGVLATTQDKVNVVATNFAKAMSVNKNLTSDQLEGVKLVAQATDEWGRATASAQIGVFSLSNAQKAVNDQMQVNIREKLLDPNNPEQYAAAVQAAANKVQALGDAAKVAGSALPQLTQLGLDAGNVNKQFDTFATTSVNAVAPALEGILNGTTSVSQGFKNLGLAVVTALEDAIIKITIIQPLINAMQASLNSSGILSFLGIGGSGAAGLTSVGGAPLSVGGITLGGPDGPVPFANGGTLTGGWGVVGEQGPELINVHSQGVTVIPNHISKPYLPGFADGGSLSSSGNVTRLPGGGMGAIHVAQGDTHINVQGSMDKETMSYVNRELAKRDAAFTTNVVKTVRTARQGRQL